MFEGGSGIQRYILEGVDLKLALQLLQNDEW